MLRKINFVPACRPASRRSRGQAGIVHGSILSAFSAILLILAYPRFNLEFLAWFALIPLFYALENKNIKERFLIGCVFGAIFFSGILYWLFRVTVPGTLALISLLCIIPTIFCLLYRPSLFIVPAAWVISEYVMSHLFTGFPWMLLGYSQYLNLHIIQIADITGPYGVSFLIAMVNVCIFAFLKKIPQKRVYAVTALSLVFFCFFYGSHCLKQNYERPLLKVACIQGNIPQDMKWDESYKKYILDKYERLTLQAAKNNPDLIIWPETSVPGLLENDKDVLKRVKDIAVSSGKYLLVGTAREDDLGFYNSATIISGNGTIEGSYDKMHLVPLGEYIPLERYIPWLRTSVDKPIGDFDFGRDFKIFSIITKKKTSSDEAILTETRFYKFAVLICYEDIFPDLARIFVKEGALFLVNITNDAWFGKTNAPYQHVQSSVFRAVENRVPVIRSANTGVTCAIDRTGRIINILNKNGETFVDGFMESEIMPGPGGAIYTRYGDIFCLACLVLYVVFFAKSTVKKHE